MRQCGRQEEEEEQVGDEDEHEMDKLRTRVKVILSRRQIAAEAIRNVNESGFVVGSCGCG